MKCLVCGEESKSFFKDDRTDREYFRCDDCNFIFAHPASRLNPRKERERYELHQNDINDAGYQKFVAPLYQWICDNVPRDAIGLDFGCGKGPVLTHLLSRHGYAIDLYDPFFHDDRSVFEKRYDFIFAVEVVEHFFYPSWEFINLKRLLKPGGVLAVMTSPFSHEIDFQNWYYRKDPTHVSFYSDRTFQVLQRQAEFETYEMYGSRVALFKNALM